MRSSLLLILLAACAAPHPSTEPVAPYDPLALVDPFIGTGGEGAEVIGLNPGAAVPFGFVQVGPDTRDSAIGQPGFYHFGGYFHEDDLIDGFAHTHANGMGVNDLGGMHVMVRDGWDDAWITPKHRAATFSHDQEHASPGRYGVTLLDQDIDVEIAATARGAVHRYTFPAGASPTLLFDLDYGLGDVTIAEASASVDGSTIEAYQLLKGGYSSRTGGIPHFAHATVEPAPSATFVWSSESGPAEGTQVEGTAVGLRLAFPAGTTEVTLRIGLSTTGFEGAAGNHAAEVAGKSVEQVGEEAEAAWREVFDAMKIGGGTEEQRIIAHTAMYHACLWPNLYQDADGAYRGFDDQIHTADHPYHSAFSLWDTFRTTHPLFTLTMPRRHEDMLRSLRLMADQGGDLPKWPIGNGYTGGMVGSPGAIVLAEAHLKGLDVGDPDAAFDIAVMAAQGVRPNAGRGGIEAYRQLGYVPHDQVGGAASRTIEYGWADHALSTWARDLGRDDVADELLAQSEGWVKTWDPDQEAFVGRNADGSFNVVEKPEIWADDYVEGTLQQYLFGVPWDVDGLIDLQDGGDREAWLARTDAFWDAAHKEPDDLLYDSYYWHGNEPALHYAFLMGLAGDRARTAREARWVLETRYDTSPAGLDGNDDAGTLSSWYLLAGSGLYPIAGTTRYALASPIFERVELGSGIVIRAEGLEDGGVVPVEIRLGDRVVEEGYVEHDELMAAGELVFVLE